MARTDGSIGNKNKPPLAPSAPAKPAGLSTIAAAEWDRLAGELASAGIVLSPAHRAAMTLASTIAADIKTAWKALQDDGEYIEAKGVIVAHPASKRIDALRRDYIKVLALLGLRPGQAGGASAQEETLSDVLES